MAKPVTFPLGRSSRATRPLTTGSVRLAKTIGIVRVSRWRATVAAVPFVRMMSGCKPVNLTESESRGQRRGESSIWQDSRFSDGEAEMDLPRSNDGNARFLAYVEGLTSV